MSDDTPDPTPPISERSASPRVKKKKRGEGRRWKKGQSGNPKGRPTRDLFVDEFMEAAVPGGEGQTPIERRAAYMMRLYTSAMDVRRKDHAKLMEMLGERYWGRPKERLEMSGPGGKPIQSADVTAPRRRTTGESRKRVEELWAKREAWVKAATARESNGHNGASTNGHAAGNGEGDHEP